jgi:hypothetical protein
MGSTMSSTLHPPAGRSASRLLAVIWLAFGGVYALIAGLLHFQVQHPHFLPATGLLALLGLATLAAILVGLWRLVVGPRLQGARLLTLGTVPLAVLGAHFGWALQYQPHEERSDSYFLRILIPLAESFMDLEARVRYPQRTTGRKVVMIHAGVENAEAEVEAMDRHVERMETLLGQTTRGKCHWVRGRLLGMERMCLFGVALGSEPGHEAVGEDGLTTLDRHEVAHWTINCSFRPYQTIPPGALIEGWAESQSGYARSELYGHAWSLRENSSWLPLSELVVPFTGKVDPRIYTEGGALVDYLLERLGGPGFFALYHGFTSASCDETIRRHVQVGLDDLDTEYVRHLEETVSRHGSLPEWRLRELRCGPEVDAVAWRRFLPRYAAEARRSAAVYANSRVRVEQTYRSVDGKKTTSWVTDYLLAGPRAAKHQSGSWPQSLVIATPGEDLVLRRDQEGTPWKSLRWHNIGGYPMRLSSLRREVEDTLASSLLTFSLTNLRNSSLAVVTRFSETDEEGGQRVRVGFELPTRLPGGAPGRAEWTLAADRGLIPVRVESQGLFGPERMVVEREYEPVAGRWLLKRSQATIDRDGGPVTVISTEVKERTLGPVPDAAFTLPALGVSREEIQDEESDTLPAQAARRWRAARFGVPAAWAGLALLLGGLLSWLGRSRLQTADCRLQNDKG